MHRWRLVAAALTAGLLAAACGAGPSGPEATPVVTASVTASLTASVPVPSPSPEPSASPTTGEPVFLALGDSLTTGFQRGTGDDLPGAWPTLLTQRLAETGPRLHVENLACAGETTTEFVSGGRCHAAPQSQLLRAETILVDGGRAVALVSVQIGANDVLRCLGAHGADAACESAGAATYSANLPEILTRLRAAAGPRVPMLVIGYYDPFRGAVAGRTLPPQVQQDSAAATDRLNAALAAAAAGAGAHVVDLRGVLEGPDGSRLCVLTSVCTTGDFHLNPAGNAAVADAVATVAGPHLEAAATS